MKNITIIGLGYVGYPLALQAASKNNKVYGVDVSEKTVAVVNNKKSPVSVDEHINALKDKVEIIATTIIEETIAENYIICVPTPINELLMPDLTVIIQAVQQVKKVLKKGDLVVIESNNISRCL